MDTTGSQIIDQAWADNEILGLIRGGPVNWMQMTSCCKSHCGERAEPPLRSSIILVNESSAYSMSQAQKHQRPGNFPRTVCNPKSNGPREDLGGGKWWKPYSNNVFIFCIWAPLRSDLRIEWSDLGGGHWKKDLHWTWIFRNEVPVGALWSKGTQSEWLHMQYLPEWGYISWLQGLWRQQPHLTPHPISPPPTKCILFIYDSLGVSCSLFYYQRCFSHRKSIHMSSSFSYRLAPVLVVTSWGFLLLVMAVLCFS